MNKAPQWPKPVRQLSLDLPHRPAMGRSDFLVAPSNAEAVARIDAWPDWPYRALILAGPPGSGKSHLAEVWRTRVGAKSVDARALVTGDVPRLAEAGALVVEDAHTPGLDENALFHLLNLTREEGLWLVITARDWPAQWALVLPDLISRLGAVPLVELFEPGDELLRAVLAKLFQDRQLAVEVEIIDYIATRMERSLGAARHVVERLDRLALQTRRRITRKLAAQVLLGEADDANTTTINDNRP